MIDTHTHLYTAEFSEDSDSAINRAIAAGVDLMIFPNIDVDSMAPMLSLHRRNPIRTRVAIGLHPTEVRTTWRSDLEKIMQASEDISPVAIGEVGIDLYWDKTLRSEQRDAFAAQIEIAKERQLPIIIHCREALDDILDVIRGIEAPLPKMVFHSFTGSAADVAKIRSVVDPMFGINGVVTFKNARDLQEAIPAIGLERIMLETDSPYLAPVPKRGTRNESAYLPYVLGKVAELLHLDPKAVEEATDRNASSFFNITDYPLTLK